MKILTIIVRVLLGLMFVVLGVNAFLNFMKPEQPLTGDPAAFMDVMLRTHYIEAIGAFEIAGGLLLLIGRYVPLGLTLIGPVIVNILIYHLCIDPKTIAPGIVVSIMALFLVGRYRKAFAGLLTP